MTSRRTRVVALMTHPVQYLAPWFRHIHAHAQTLDFRVVYVTEPTAAQQGVGFDRAFEWDIPLRDGYQSVVVRPAAAGASLDSDSFFGLDVPEAVDAVRELAPDVVLIAGWHSATQVRAILRLSRAGIPLLYRGDSHLGSANRRWAMLSRWRARHLLRRFTGYLAVGSRSREYLRAMGVAEPAIVNSPHAVDNAAFALRAAEARQRRAELRSQFGFEQQRRVVLYAGKCVGVKRPRDVIDAVAQLANGAALFVGDGPDKAMLEAYARERRVSCVFAGFLNQQQMADAYVAADALMLPGKETWGLVANEALACGLPVVMSSAVGAAADLESPGVCRTVPLGDTAMFAEALGDVITRQRSAEHTTRDCEAVAARCTFAAATAGLVAAAGFAHRHRRVDVTAPSRVLALCGNFVFAGGMERNTFEALAAVRRGGADVHVLVNGWSSRPIAELAERIGATWQVGHYDAPLDGVFRRPLRMLRALGDVFASSQQVLRLVMSRRVTHVLAADFRAVLLHAPALALCRVLKVPVILRSGVAPTPTTMHGRLWRWGIGPVVSRHVSNSVFIANELRAVGMRSDRVTTISNVPPHREESSQPQGRVPGRIAYVGQIIPEKGVLELLDAVGLLINAGHDVSVDIAGDMEGWSTGTVQAYRTTLRRRAAEPDLAGRVRFRGWCENIDVVLREASVHCCPSQPEQREGFGTTVIEAKRAGIPSVVCPSGGLPELIDHQVDGWITTGFDARAVAEGLGWLLSDAKTIENAQDAAAASSRRFDPRVFEERWQQEFGLRATVANGHTKPTVVTPVVQRP